MEPLFRAEPFEDAAYLFQVKWDGVRILAHVGQGRVYLHNRKLSERTLHYPELLRLADLVQGEAVLDGEMVALKEGRPSFPLVLERDLVAPGTAAARRAKVLVPVCYMIFDIVYRNGKDLTGLPLRVRQDILAETVAEDDVVHLVESFDSGVALFGAVTEQEMEGIVAKRRESAYVTGKKSDAWLKIKKRMRQLAVIGGYTVKQGQINALLAGAYLGERLVYIGRVATGLRGSDLAGLTPFLRNSRRETPPFAGASPGKDKVWVEPQLVMLVEFLEWTGDLRMRQPVIKGFTKDRTAACRLNREA
jgi:DNA ligase D-like protein (predicted ligase)